MKKPQKPITRLRRFWELVFGLIALAWGAVGFHTGMEHVTSADAVFMTEESKIIYVSLVALGGGMMYVGADHFARHVVGGVGAEISAVTAKIKARRTVNKMPPQSEENANV